MPAIVVAAWLAAPALGQVARTFDQPAQPLGPALRAFAIASGVQIVVDERAANGRSAPALKGAFSIEAALERLLIGTDMAARRGASGVWIVTRAIPAPADPEIVVTARKREEKAIDVPIALYAASGSRLEQRGIANVATALAEAPGVGVYDQGNGIAKITIRGVSTSLGANENGYYLDDLPFTGVTVPLDPDVRAWDLDRIEVLRGPQGTLFGEGSMGGTIRILAHGADLDRIEAKGSSFISGTDGGGTNHGLKAALNLPIVPGVLAIRLAGTTERFSGWIDDAAAGRRDVNRQAFDTLRAKLRFDPGERLSIIASYWRYDGGFPGGGANATDAGLVPAAGYFATRTRYRLIGATARHDLGFADLFYSFSRNRFALPQDGPYLGGRLDATIDIGVDAHELRLSSKGGGPLKWTIGGYARDASRTDGLVFALYGVDNVSVTRSRARAVFGEASYTLPFAPIDLTAGLRHYHERLTGNEINSGVASFDGAPVYHSWNPRFSIAWHPAAKTMLYASAAKGFRSGQLQPSPSVTLGAQYGLSLPAALRQDSIWTYEVGAKAELFDRRLTLEGALYHSDWKDVTVRIPIGTTGFNGLINSPGSHTKGIEGSATWRPARGLGLTVGGSWNDAVYTGSVAGTGVRRGAPVDDIARFVASAGADYSFALSDRIGGFGHIGWQHSSPRRFTAFPGYAPGDRSDRIDARIGLTRGRVTVAAFADNLTDDRGAINFRTVQPLASGAIDVSAVRLRPRTIGLQIDVRWGG